MLFDTDGVVVNSKEMFSEKISRENNIHSKDIVPFFTEIFVPKCMVGEADLKKEIIPWLDRWKWKGTVDEILNYWFEAENCIDNQVIEFVKSQREKGVKCFIVTNQEKYRTDYLRKEMGFSQLFDGVFSSAELRCKKPSPKFFELVFLDLQKKFNFDKKEILFVDNDLENVRAGQKFGFEVLHFNSVKDLISLSE